MKNMIHLYYNRFFRKQPEMKDFEYLVGNYSLLFPYSHKLPVYQSNFKKYDKSLIQIVQSISQFEKTNVIIDIGANVGDTAALLRSISNSRILCIEGDDLYLDYLRKNAKMLSDVIIEDCYVDSFNGEVFCNVQRSSGTAKIIRSVANNECAKIKTKCLSSILSNHHIDLNTIQLIKIDTDGFDFQILLSSKDILEIAKPNLYFEYDISFNDDDLSESIELISYMGSIGYRFIVYDNFGNLLDYVFEDWDRRFAIYNDYLQSCRKNGGGINYFDVFASINHDIVSYVINSEKQLE